MRTTVVLWVALAAVGGATQEEGGPASGPAADVGSDTPAGSTSIAAADEAAKVAREFFAEPDAARRAELAGRFAACAPRTPDALRRLLRGAYPFAQVEPGVSEFRTRPQGVVPAIRYLVNVPKGYAAKRADGWPLVMGLHGTGGTAENQLASLLDLLGPDASNYLLVCPQAPDAEAYKFDRLAVDYPVAVLHDVRCRMNVKADRAVIAGYSKGGYTAWGAVLFRPGEWAGAVPMASFSLTDAGRQGCRIYMTNVLPVAIQHLSLIHI